MRTSDMIKSKFWRGKDLEGRPPVTLTIADVTEELVGRGKHQEPKCFLWFNEGLKGLQLNKKRIEVLEYAYGPDSDLWRDKRVRLSFDPTVMFGDKVVGGVRLETPPGAVYRPAAGAPGAPVNVPAGAPPPPVWNGREWVTQQPPAAPAPPPPPAPVWNGATGRWEIVNPGTGEIVPPRAPATPPAPYAPPPTISQRIAQGSAADQAWDKDYKPVAVAGDPDFDDPIPF
jgi:hypothetical protein